MSSSLCYNVLTTLLLLILNVIPSSTVISKDVYRKIGGFIILELEPKPTERVKSIIWKHNRDKAAEWFEEDAELEPTRYGNFKLGTVLSMETWSLNISDLQPGFSGEYSAEVNNKDPTHSVNLIVLGSVSKPDVRKECDSESHSCTLTCNGTGEGTYSWIGAEGNELSVLTVDQKDKEVQYTCNFSNSVSWETGVVSVPKKYVPLSAGVIAAAVCIPALLFVLIVLLIVLYEMRKKHIGPCWKTYSPVETKDGNEGGAESINMPAKSTANGQADNSGGGKPAGNTEGGAESTNSTTDPTTNRQADNSGGGKPAGNTEGVAESTNPTTNPTTNGQELADNSGGGKPAGNTEGGAESTNPTTDPTTNGQELAVNSGGDKPAGNTEGGAESTNPTTDPTTNGQAVNSGGDKPAGNTEGGDESTNPTTDPTTNGQELADNSGGGKPAGNTEGGAESTNPTTDSATNRQEPGKNEDDKHPGEAVIEPQQPES